MFAGAGDFFRPVDPRKEVSPAAVIRPASRSGDEPQKRNSDEPQKHAGDASQKFSIDGSQDSSGEVAADETEDCFSGDAVELSIAALFVMLAGRSPPRAEDSPVPPQQAPRDEETHRAFDAYQRAVSALPSTALPPRTDITRVQDAGGEIFYMLAALEKAGVQAVTVAGGQTIYAALRRQCRAHDIALAVPASAPDNNSR